MEEHKRGAAFDAQRSDACDERIGARGGGTGREPREDLPAVAVLSLGTLAEPFQLRAGRRGQQGAGLWPFAAGACVQVGRERGRSARPFGGVRFLAVVGDAVVPVGHTEAGGAAA